MRLIDYKDDNTDFVFVTYDIYNDENWLCVRLTESGFLIKKELECHKTNEELIEIAKEMILEKVKEYKNV